MNNQLYDDIIVRLRCDFDGEESDIIRWIVDVYFFDESVSTNEVPGIHIGKGSMTYYDATRFSPYDLRMIAQVHGANRGEFQVLNSVRIFSDHQELRQFSRGDASDVDEGVLDPTDFTPDELEDIKDWNRYDEECTVNVYGRLVSFEDLVISPDYNNRDFSTVIVQKITDFFEKIGMDFMLVMPVPLHSNRLDEVSYKRQTKDVIELYESLEFEFTKGKLYDYCMVKQLSW